MRAAMKIIGTMCFTALHLGVATTLPDRVSFIAEKLYYDADCNNSKVRSVTFLPKDLCYMEIFEYRMLTCENGTLQRTIYEEEDEACASMPPAKQEDVQTDCHPSDNRTWVENDCEMLDGEGVGYAAFLEYSHWDCRDDDLMTQHYWPTGCFPFEGRDARVRSAWQICEDGGQSTRWMLFTEDDCKGEPLLSTESELWSSDAAGSCKPADLGTFSSLKFVGCGGPYIDHTVTSTIASTSTSTSWAARRVLPTSLVAVYAVASAGVALTSRGA